MRKRVAYTGSLLAFRDVDATPNLIDFRRFFLSQFQKTRKQHPHQENMKVLSIVLSQVLLAAPANGIFFNDNGPATTVFGPPPAGAGPDIGLPPGAGVLGPVLADSDFDFDGEILFFQNGEYYVGGAAPAAGQPLSPEGLENLGGPVGSNRAFGYAGEGCATIDFSSFAVDSVVIQARGTDSGDNIGANFPGRYRW